MPIASAKTRMSEWLFVLAVAITALAVLVRFLEPRLTFFPGRGEMSTPAAVGIPYETATIATADGEQLRGWLLPHERPRAFVVYFHGNGGNLSLWLPVLAGVHREGFAVAAVDYRGYGLSTGAPTELGLYRDVDAIVAWARPLRPADVPLVFWGRSLGATMAAYAATKTPPDRLILESGFPGVRSVIRDSPVLFALSVFASYRLPTAEYASRAACPVLVMHGDADRVIPFRNGRALHDALPEPKRFEVIRGGDHNDLAPPDPERYWRTVHDFVAGRSAFAAPSDALGRHETSTATRATSSSTTRSAGPIASKRAPAASTATTASPSTSTRWPLCGRPPASTCCQGRCRWAPA